MFIELTLYTTTGPDNKVLVNVAHIISVEAVHATKQARVTVSEPYSPQTDQSAFYVAEETYSQVTEMLRCGHHVVTLKTVAEIEAMKA